MYFIAEKRYFKQCGNPCFSIIVWRKQFMDGNAGGGNRGTVYQCFVFVAEREMRN